MNVKLKNGNTVTTSGVSVVKRFGRSQVVIENAPSIVCKDIDEITGDILLQIGDELAEVTSLSFFGTINAPVIRTNKEGVETLRHYLSGKASDTVFAGTSVAEFELA